MSKSSVFKIKTVLQLLREGYVRRVIGKDDKGKALFDFPVIIGVGGISIAPWFAALGVFGAFVTNCTIFVERVTKELFIKKHQLFCISHLCSTEMIFKANKHLNA